MFVLFCFIGGLCNVLIPKKVIEFRKKLPFGTSWVSGGFFYRTEFRVQIVGIALLLISALIVFAKLS